ncbi:MAG: RnfABCDGE type electron transport complex subunit D, partial [Oscillospiraceae bacterium]
GLGKNFANPAIVGRIFLFVSFATPMTTWAIPQFTNGSVEYIAGATPLVLMAQGNMEALPTVGAMAMGIRGGCIGETATAALLIGGIYLMIKKVITPTIPVAFLGTVIVMSLLLGVSPVYHILAGGVMLGAMFMATDYVTSPTTEKGKLIFGIGCGIITMVIRVFGNYPEGVSFAILLMNIVTPHIQRLTRTKPIGGIK